MRDHTEILEAQLHTLWLQQKIPRAFMLTREGVPVEVINPGQYNREGGPDFRRATLRLGGKILQGDVEIHVHARAWSAHGHHLDPAYNEVILHLALAPADGAQSSDMILRENGLPVTQMLLPVAILPAPVVENFALFSCPLSQTSPEKILATARRAAQLRLEAKAQALAEQLAQTSWDQALYRGMAEALGYDKNQEPFRRLAEVLPIELLFAELRAARAAAPDLLLDALLFGAAGFLTREDAIDAEAAAFIAPRLAVWEELRHTLQIRALRREAWQFFRLRPRNFPTRRLAAMSALILKFHRMGILEHMAGMVTALGRQPQKLARELLQFVLCPASGFWREHYDLRGRQRTGRAVPAGDLIGRERALDIVANIFLPALWLYYREAGDGALQSQVREAYGALPRLQENQISRRMRQQLSAKYPIQKKVAASAAGQQGLIHLHKLYCRPLRCEECLALSEGKISAK